MDATKIMIQGDRLDGKHPMSKVKFLTLVTRGLALPRQEVLTKWGWTSGPVVSVVLALDTGRRRVESSHYAVNGLIYDSAIKTDEVSCVFVSHDWIRTSMTSIVFSFMTTGLFVHLLIFHSDHLLNSIFGNWGVSYLCW